MRPSLQANRLSRTQPSAHPLGTKPAEDPCSRPRARIHPWKIGLAWSGKLRSNRNARGLLGRDGTKYGPKLRDRGRLESRHFSVKANTDDNPNWGQAMNGPLAEGYWQACIKKYEILVKMDVWDKVKREGWMNILPGTWAFKCKRFPDGLVQKLKARFCVMGNHQVENVDYFEMFAPVVNWNTVRILLTMSQLLRLATKQVDYTAAFVHAPLDKPPNYDEMTDLEKEHSGVYIEMPRGFAEERSGKVLKLNKSFYGLKQSLRNFFLCLKGNLEAVGLQQSEADPCLFVNDKVICLVYVDDTLFFAKEMSDIDDLIEDLQKTMVLEVEEDVAGFLGVHIDRRDDGTINLTQTGLIDRIITALIVRTSQRNERELKSDALAKTWMAIHAKIPSATRA
jgi:hypothetical protein